MIRVTLGGGLQVTVDFSRSTKCRGCGQDIYWCVTDSGQRMPLVILSHFADCPKADEFRKKKEAKKEEENLGQPVWPDPVWPDRREGN
jgi:hypothetical protein